MQPGDAGAAPRVLVAGAGVAGLETLLALRALVGERVDITLVSPEAKFVNRSMAVNQPSKPPRMRGLRLADIAVDLAAHWHRGALDRVEHERRVVVTDAGAELPYDALVLAPGAHSEREWHSKGALTYHGRRDSPEYRLLLRQLCERRVSKLAFVRPAGASWPLPLYDLALATAAECAAHGVEVELSLITPEEEPLAIFGPRATAAIRGLLEDRGIALRTGSHGVPSRPGRLHISPGGQRVAVDRIVTLPRLAGPRLGGVPCGPDGFISTDAHGRVTGMDDVYAAGDATAFPIKQGGLAAQQADAVVETIAAWIGADIDPQPFRPVLRGILLTGGRARYLRAHSGESTVSEEALWWPPNRLCGRYLAPYLSSQVGFAADVLPQDDEAISVEIALDAQTGPRTFHELHDLASPGRASKRWPTGDANCT